VCKHCDKPIEFSTGKKHYASYHRECSQRDVSVRQKYVDSMTNKYGVPVPLQNAEIRTKIENTMLIKYGSKHFTSTDKLKMHNATIFDGMYHNQRNISSALQYVDDPVWLTEQNQTHTFEEIANLIGVSQSLIQKRFKKFELTPTLRSSSSFELQVIDVLDQLGITTISRSKINGIEVDVYMPDLKIGLELDGLYWHGETQNRPQNYHLNKTQKCADVGIQLIHITDYEWIVKKPIVISRLTTIVNKSYKLPARKCTIKILTQYERKQFFNSTHIQGDVGSSVAYGLIHCGEVVAAMSFGRPRYNKSYQWELLRLSSKLNTTVVGGASKLLTHFMRIHTPINLVSYSDRRWSVGNVYKQLGFKWQHNATPNFFYFKGNYTQTGMQSRLKFQKFKLPSIFGDIDMTKTAWQIMQDCGYDRYWDCGNGVWVYES
jgi:hypothetical protein